MNAHAAPRLRAVYNRVKQQPVCELPLLFSSLVQLPDCDDSPALIYSPPRTFWLFLYQILSPGMFCQEVVHKTNAWLWRERREKASSGTSAYCQARRRLDLNWLLALARQIASRIEDPVHYLWLSRRMLNVDGSSLSMPDTPENQSRWPQPRGKSADADSPPCASWRFSPSPPAL